MLLLLWRERGYAQLRVVACDDQILCYIGHTLAHTSGQLAVAATVAASANSMHCYPTSTEGLLLSAFEVIKCADVVKGAGCCVYAYAVSLQETLTYAALLRLPKTMSRTEKTGRVEQVIDALGLRKSKDTIIGELHSEHVNCGGLRAVHVAAARAAQQASASSGGARLAVCVAARSGAASVAGGCPTAKSSLDIAGVTMTGF